MKLVVDASVALKWFLRGQPSELHLTEAEAVGTAVEGLAFAPLVLISIVEIFNNGATTMATMNFSIPDDVRQAFNKAFEGENKSAVVARLLRKAVEERERRAKQDEQLDALIAELLRIRAEDPPATDEGIRRVRLEGRP